MSSLMDLPSELQEKIFEKLESVEDVISLGSSCTQLAMVVNQVQVSFWRLLLDKTTHISRPRLRNLATFVSSLDKADSIFSLLRNTIYERNPASHKIDSDGEIVDDECKDDGYGYEYVSDCAEETIIVSFPPSPELHPVSVAGLQLLVLIDRHGARHRIHTIKVCQNSPRPSTLLSLASMASLQKEMINQTNLQPICTTEEEGMALVAILERSIQLSMGQLVLVGGVGRRTWEGLGRNSYLTWGCVKTERKVVRRGRRKDLQAIYKLHHSWFVDGENIDGPWEFYDWNEGFIKEGWKKIKNMTLKRKRKSNGEKEGSKRVKRFMQIEPYTEIQRIKTVLKNLEDVKEKVLKNLEDLEDVSEEIRGRGRGLKKGQEEDTVVLCDFTYDTFKMCSFKPFLGQ